MERKIRFGNKLLAANVVVAKSGKECWDKILIFLAQVEQ